IAGAAGRIKGGNLAARHTLGRGNHFPNAETRADAKVVDVRSGIFEGPQDSQMRGGEVENVNEIANAGAVGRWVVRSVDGNGAARSKSRTQDVRNKVRFRIVEFTVVLHRTSGIEVAKHGIAQSVDAVKPVKHDFGLQLGLAVGICGTLQSVLG